MNGAGDDAVDRGLGERIELSVFATHEVRLEDVAAAAVVLERPEVQLHRQVCTRHRTSIPGRSFLQILPTPAFPFSHSGFTISISQTVYFTSEHIRLFTF